MKDEKDTFYLVRGDFLPEAMKKTLQVKKDMERGKATSIYEAVQKVGLSRSAFYKYRDAVFPFQAIQQTKIITLFFHLEDRSGTLSHLLDMVAKTGGNILTIHQSIPLNGKANVTLSLDIENLKMDLDELLKRLKQHQFIEKVDVLGSGA
ncbi:chorismate mutase [Halolactibacillus halophilus]|uniref:UPF0735 ACT domain-containing protein HHA03_01110 n=1 Tax=Halolactibacillus halophilus TaxID=306540 RepID=A0A1I5L038_9BACI|nr:ACT domain-containing protein [Halolactibacillus halophilus]GEM00579.1 UPF0735 ACT domain-containing protein YszB [Halolactibacillus halophilus]SFO90502.1 chorismate mutase [Halolactibacillus halophilus]